MYKLKLITQLGRFLIRRCPLSVSGYIVAAFVSQTAIPLALPVLLAQLTNSFQAAAQHPLKASLGIKSSYEMWLALTVVALPFAILFRIAQNRMDSRMEKEVREELFDRVIRREPEFFQQ